MSARAVRTRVGAVAADRMDLKRTLAGYRARRGVFEIIDVPEARYLMIDGHGDPNTSPEYAAALAAIYPVAYRLKFSSKQDLGADYVVPPLEGLWWADDMDAFSVSRDKSRWDWTLMLMTPEWIDEAPFEAAVERVRAAAAPARLGDVRFTALAEGRCVQTLHVGPYDEEGPVLDRMHHEFIPSHGLRMTGRHHEIYLSDARRTAPERLRTILRQPVATG